MATPKAKTLQERFGFFDEELKTPAHDALMLWIDENIAEILAEVFNLTIAPKIVTKKWEKPIQNERDFILGAADMFVHAHSGRDHFALFIEAKPKIRSLGELIRQINFYKTGSNFTVHTGMDYIWPKWLVVSPDVQFADKLREQGILFQKSPPTI
jgi:hypothetical protein